MDTNTVPTVIAIILFAGVLYMTYTERYFDRYMNPMCTVQSPAGMTASMTASVRGIPIMPTTCQYRQGSRVDDTPRLIPNQEANERFAQLKPTPVSTQSAKTARSPSGHEPKNDRPEKGVVKLCVYHMKNCHHCHDIVRPGANGKSKLQELRELFSNTDSVKILDFEYGVDNEASKFQSFPTILIITENGSTEYNGNRTTDDMKSAILSRFKN